MTSGSFSINDDELALLLAPSTTPVSSKLLRILWFQQTAIPSHYPLENVEVTQIDELQLQLQQSNEFDAIVFNCAQLDSNQLTLLAGLLEEQSQISVFLVGQMPNMAFNLPDFTYCESQQELIEQFTHWCNSINAQYREWAANKSVYIYSPVADQDLQQQMKNLGFGETHTWQAKQDNVQMLLQQANLVVVSVFDDDPEIIDVIESLASVLHRPGLFLLFQEQSTLKNSITLLTKHYGLNLYTSLLYNQFTHQVAYLSRQFFRLYRHKLNQLSHTTKHSHYLIHCTYENELIGYWDWPETQRQSDETLEFSEPVNAVYWHHFKYELLKNNIELTCIAKHYSNIMLAFSPEFPMDNLSSLIRIKQQQVKLAWQPNLVAQLKNHPTVLDLVDVLVISLDMWILLNVNNDNRAFWQSVKQRCQDQQVSLAILGVQSELIQYWRDKGFDLLIHRDDAE
ncbi:hypothetical protein [Agarivorans sp. Toyoura001]|uniref:hypothetical protein n=1 Tax=unclassified Agarivorans TaxID=2636026 RepID=UPI0010D68F09|nr:hypothetical protein [Agarivorans sp. Toyoura001]GDY25788.1 hypothetical protein AHAT_16780 [Agarivorans sp. Toyoura001]